MTTGMKDHRSRVHQPIPVIDLFAGPGGLGEGFATAKNGSESAFRVELSVESEPAAYRTLLLRSFLRQFDAGVFPDAYTSYVKGELRDPDGGFPETIAAALPAKIKNDPRGLAGLASAHPLEFTSALSTAKLAEIGSTPDVDQAIDTRVSEYSSRGEPWVLVGGPPCQAYSIAGRARMRSRDPAAFEADRRHTLYQHYLKLIARHGPDVFVMENVKGLLSSELESRRLIDHLMRDLSAPCRAAQDMDGAALDGAPNPPHDGYTLHALAREPGLDLTGFPVKASDFIVEAERFGLPQTRHRVFIVGVRRGANLHAPRLLREKGAETVQDRIGKMPKLRSRVSRQQDGPDLWKKAILAEIQATRLEEEGADADVCAYMRKVGDELDTDLRHGGRCMQARSDDPHQSSLGLILNHETRRHIPRDLLRYLYLSCHADLRKDFPRLRDLPAALVPHHRNAERARKERYGYFNDRFRVQMADRPASTITSHIHKDGHYFIHPDPGQCRTLTVREAARLQTFPDDYFFEGSKTEQYIQVGNAVPPDLAQQIAGIVAGVLEPRLSRGETPKLEVA